MPPSPAPLSPESPHPINFPASHQRQTRTRMRPTLLILSIPVFFSAILTFFISESFSFPHDPVPDAARAYPGLDSLNVSLDSLYPLNWPVFTEGEDASVDDGWAAFPFGRTRYWMLGPKNGEKIVLIHGLSVPSLIWKDVALALAKDGFRVLIYDLYGRGYSDAPTHIQYTTGLYTTQLALLMHHVQWEKANIAGLSMGGGIATAFAASFPDLVSRKLVLIASTGLMESSDFSRTSKVMSSPIVQFLSSTAPARMLLRNFGTSGESSDNPIHEIVRIQSAWLPGFDNAVASSLRHGPLRGLREAFSSLSDIPAPTLDSRRKAKPELLLIWGTNDRTVPYRYANKIMELVKPPQSRLITIEGGEHDLTVSHPKEVTEAIVQFMKG